MKYRRQTLKKVAKVKRSVERGADSIQQIVKDTGINYMQVWGIVRKERIEFPSKKENNLIKINRDIQSREFSMGEIAERAGVTPYNFGCYILRNEVNVPEYIEPNRCDKDLCAMVEVGTSLTEMGKTFGFSRESARILLHGTGLYREWYAKAQHRGNKPREDRIEIYKK